MRKARHMEQEETREGKGSVLRNVWRAPQKGKGKKINEKKKTYHILEGTTMDEKSKQRSYLKKSFRQGNESEDGL